MKHYYYTKSGISIKQGLFRDLIFVLLHKYCHFLLCYISGRPRHAPSDYSVEACNNEKNMFRCKTSLGSPSGGTGRVAFGNAPK